MNSTLTYAFVLNYFVDKQKPLTYLPITYWSQLHLNVNKTLFIYSLILTSAIWVYVCCVVFCFQVATLIWTTKLSAWKTKYNIVNACGNCTFILYTVKPELTTTSEQRPPVNNGHYFWVPKVIVVHKFDCNSKNLICFINWELVKLKLFFMYLINHLISFI